MDTDYTTNITCPHCGSESPDSWDVQSDSGYEECDVCGGHYFFERQIDVTYSTTKTTKEEIDKEDQERQERINKTIARWKKQGIL